MLKSIKDKVTKKQNEFACKCEKAIIDSFNTELYSTISNLPDGWIQKRDYFNLSAGYGSIKVHTLKSIPCMVNSYSINISKEKFEEIKSISASIDEMKEKGEQIKNQIVATLLKLRTPDKIKKEFPEAYQNLPKDVMQLSTVAALPITDILQNISKFPD